jgi:hypothetical protein
VRGRAAAAGNDPATSTGPGARRPPPPLRGLNRWCCCRAQTRICPRSISSRSSLPHVGHGTALSRQRARWIAKDARPYWCPHTSHDDRFGGGIQPPTRHRKLLPCPLKHGFRPCTPGRLPQKTKQRSPPQRCSAPHCFTQLQLAAPRCRKNKTRSPIPRLAARASTVRSPWDYAMWARSSAPPPRTRRTAPGSAQSGLPPGRNPVVDVGAVELLCHARALPLRAPLGRSSAGLQPARYPFTTADTSSITAI